MRGNPNPFEDRTFHLVRQRLQMPMMLGKPSMGFRPTSFQMVLWGNGRWVKYSDSPKCIYFSPCGWTHPDVFTMVMSHWASRSHTQAAAKKAEARGCFWWTTVISIVKQFLGGVQWWLLTVCVRMPDNLGGRWTAMRNWSFSLNTGCLLHSPCDLFNSMISVGQRNQRWNLQLGSRGDNSLPFVMLCANHLWHHLTVHILKITHGSNCF